MRQSLWLLFLRDRGAIRRTLCAPDWSNICGRVANWKATVLHAAIREFESLRVYHLKPGRVPAGFIRVPPVEVRAVVWGVGIPTLAFNQKSVGSIPIDGPKLGMFIPTRCGSS